MNAYLFDVDGVLNNSRSTIINQQFIPILIKKLYEGHILGIISGRSMLWLRAEIVKAFENYLNDHPGFNQKLIDNLYVSGEFGGVFCVHIDGKRKESVNKHFAIPEEIKRGLHLISFQYSDYVFIVEDKQTIFSAVAKENVTEKEFHLRKNDMIEDFKQVIASDPELEVHSDRIAINIRNKQANKSYATDMFLNWLKEKGLSPEKFIVFGDSPTDLEMGEELHRQQKQFDFIYVGDKSEIAHTNQKFQVTVTNGNLDEGTLEYLKQQ